MLTDFFRINLPYGMKKNEAGQWFVFNREYVPLGWNSTDKHQSIFKDDAYADMPVYTHYKGLTEARLLKLAHHPENGVKRNDNGEIVRVFFYNDRTNPQNDPGCWPEYMERIKLLSKSDVKREYSY